MDEELIKHIAYALVEANEPGCDPEKWWGDVREDGSDILRWHMGYRNDAKAAIKAMVEYYRQSTKSPNVYFFDRRVGAGLGCLECEGLEFSVMYPMPFRVDHYALHCKNCGRLKETHDGDKIVTHCVDMSKKDICEHGHINIWYSYHEDVRQLCADCDKEILLIPASSRITHKYADGTQRDQY